MNQYDAGRDGTNWGIMVLAALTNSFVVAIQSTCLPVLFNEISHELNFTLVQVGVIWGIGALPGIFSSLAGGAIIDRLGPRRILIIGCGALGIAGALRGLSFDFISFIIAVVILGLLTPFISLSTLKTCRVWFSQARLGLASGFLSMGMALGFILATLVSAAYLSPLLGGWRNVLFLYGGLAAIFSLFWLLSPGTPVQSIQTAAQNNLSMRQSLGQVVKIKRLWLMGLVGLGVSGCIQGSLGYLPLYLRNLGWEPVLADQAVATFHIMSLIFVIPITNWSDRIGSRRTVMLVATACFVFGVSLLSVVNGPLLWAAIILVGFTRDGFMGVFMTMIMETDGVGPKFAGSATGLVMVIMGIGNLVAPPIGNSLAKIAPGLPFLFWASMVAMSFICLLSVKEKRELKPGPQALNS